MSGTGVDGGDTPPTLLAAVWHVLANEVHFEVEPESSLTTTIREDARYPNETQLADESLVWFSWMQTSLMAMIVMQLVLELFLRVIVPRWSFAQTFTPVQRVQLPIKLISTWHGMACVYYCTRTLYEERAVLSLWWVSPVATRSAFFEWWCAVSVGYLAFDLTNHVRFKRRLQVEANDKDWWPMFVHHVVAMFIFGQLLAVRMGEAWLLLFWFTEISTPFLHARWVLYATGRTSTTAYGVNGFLLWFCFTLRLGFNALCLVRMYNIWHVIQNVRWLARWCMAGPPLLMLMNLAWYVKVTQGSIRHAQRVLRRRAGNDDERAPSTKAKRK